MNDNLILVCSACRSIDVVSGEDLFGAMAESIHRHREHSPQCAHAKFWTGTRLEDYPEPLNVTVH